MYAHEKKGGAARDGRKMEEFRKALTDCELVDMGFKGKKVGKGEILRAQMLEKDLIGVWRIVNG